MWVCAPALGGRGGRPPGGRADLGCCASLPGWLLCELRLTPAAQVQPSLRDASLHSAHIHAPVPLRVAHRTAGLGLWGCSQRCLSLGTICEEFHWDGRGWRRGGGALGWRGATHQPCVSARRQRALTQLPREGGAASEPPCCSRLLTTAPPVLAPRDPGV